MVSRSTHSSEEYEKRIAELRALIDEGDADIAAGRVHVYKSARELSDEIIRRSRRSRKKVSLE